MTRRLDIEDVLDDWFGEGPSQIADRVVDAALLDIDRTAQRSGVLRLPRRPFMKSPFHYAAIGAAIVAIVAVGSVLLPRGGQGDVGGAPTAIPSSAPVSVAPASAEPSATVARGLRSLVLLEHFGGRLDAATGAPGENELNKLWIFDPTGSPSVARELLPGRPGSQSGAAWSADGARIAFTNFGPTEQIYLTDATGTAPTLLDLPCLESCDNIEPAFSPDGTRIAFKRVQFGDGRAVTPTRNVLAIVELASGEVTELASTAIDVKKTNEWNNFPRWSPDGTQIAFFRTTYGSTDKATGSALYVMNADGTGLTKLSTVPFAGDPEWSPDGSTIAFSTHSTHAEFSTGELITKDVYTVHPDGTGLRQVTTDGLSTAPVWTSDGRIAYIAFPLSGGIQATDVWVMAADGSAYSVVTRFVSGPGQCCTTYAQVQPTP